MSSDQLISELKAMAEAMSGNGVMNSSFHNTKNNIINKNKSSGFNYLLKPKLDPNFVELDNREVKTSVPSTRQAFLDEVDKLAKELLNTRLKLGIATDKYHKNDIKRFKNDENHPSDQKHKGFANSADAKKNKIPNKENDQSAFKENMSRVDIVQRMLNENFSSNRNNDNNYPNDYVMTSKNRRKDNKHDQKSLLNPLLEYLINDNLKTSDKIDNRKNQILNEDMPEKTEVRSRDTVADKVKNEIKKDLEIFRNDGLKSGYEDENALFEDEDVYSVKNLRETSKLNENYSISDANFVREIAKTCDVEKAEKNSSFNTEEKGNKESLYADFYINNQNNEQIDERDACDKELADENLDSIDVDGSEDWEEVMEGQEEDETEENIANESGADNSDEVVVSDGVQTTVIFCSTDPQRYRDMETFGKWRYEEIYIPIKEHLLLQYNRYKHIFKSNCSDKTNEKKKLSPEKVEKVLQQIHELKRLLVEHRIIAKKHRNNKKDLDSGHSENAAVGNSNLQIIIEEKEQIKEKIRELKEIIKKSVFFADLVEDICKNDEVNKNVALKNGNHLKDSNNVITANISTPTNTFVLPSFLCGGGVTIEQNQQMISKYKQMVLIAKRDHKKFQNLILQRSSEPQALIDQVGSSELSLQKNYYFPTAVPIPYLSKSLFVHKCFPDVTFIEENYLNYLFSEDESNKGKSSLAKSVKDFPIYVCTFPFDYFYSSKLSIEDLRRASTITPHHPMTIMIRKDIVFDAATAKGKRKEALIKASSLLSTEEDKGALKSCLRNSLSFEMHPPKAILSKFSLPVIMDPYRTGFEEEKDLPLILPQTNGEENGENIQRKKTKKKKNSLTAEDNSNGMIIAGRYQLLDLLGQATFSRAVRCIDLKQRYEFDEESQEYNLVQLDHPDPPVDLSKTADIDGSNEDFCQRMLNYDSDDESFGGINESEFDTESEVEIDNNGSKVENFNSKNSRSVDCYAQVCLKIINNTKEFFDQSLDEIRLLHLLNNHGNPDSLHFVRMYDYFYHREHTFLVTELLSDNLYEYGKFIKESGEPVYFTVPRLRRIARQILTALNYVHSLNLIHCDLKPENVLFVSHRRCVVKVIDFGSSCFISDHLSSYVQSRSYRAPEVILGANYDGRIDIWSLGAIMVELITNEVLFQSETAAEMLARIVSVCGKPLPRRLLYEGRTVSQFLTRFGCIYEYGEKADVEDCYYLYTPVHEYVTVNSTDSLVEGTEANASSKHPNRSNQSANDENSSFTERVVIPFSSLHKKLDPFEIYPNSPIMDFIEKCLELDYTERPTSADLLNHPFILEPDVDEEYIIQ